MNGVYHNDINSDTEKTYPGCLGRMVSLFELNVGVPSHRLLNDKPLQGSSLSRSSTGVSRISPSGGPIKERVIIPEVNNRFSNRKPSGTPMKTLIAQEMSKEVDSRRDSPNLVAKLMGLDALPQQEPDSAILRSHSPDHPRNDSDMSMSYWQLENRFSDYTNPNVCQDVPQIWKQSQELPHVARYDDINEENMSLVRQKFNEAKSLSMNENLQQSKQFQDSTEVLGSSRDLFLKYLQDCRQSTPPPPGTKRITVLRPSKMANTNDFAGAGNKDGDQMKYDTFVQMSGLQKVHPGSSPAANIKHYENSTRPTQIVVLKPSHGKARDVKAVGSLYSELSRMLHREDFSGDVEYDENQEIREIAKAITQKMRARLGISSVLSNGYAGDESSFHNSEVEYADGNLSDSESSSFTRASYTSESSVCKEAKKRLSERWAKMASNGICQEKRHFQRSSSTLGEMLALSETKTSSHAKGSDILLISEQRREENMHNLPTNLMRSKSLPVSATEFGTRLNVGISVSNSGKLESLVEDTNVQSAKLSFKGKVSSLFLSRNKQPGKDKSLVSDTKDEFYLSPGGICSNGTESLSDKGSSHASTLLEPSSKASSDNPIYKRDRISPEIGLFVEKPTAVGNRVENQDHPSPVSVLDPSYEGKRTAEMFPHYSKPDKKGVGSSLNSMGSHLIDKSPHIGSIARSLPWDDSCVNPASSHTPNKLTIQETDEEEQEQFFYVNTLLSSSEVRGVSDDNWDDCLVVDSVARKEVAGSWWSDQFSLEMDNLGREIEWTLLEELVMEVVELKLT